MDNSIQIGSAQVAAQPCNQSPGDLSRRRPGVLSLRRSVVAPSFDTRRIQGRCFFLAPAVPDRSTETREDCPPSPSPGLLCFFALAQARNLQKFYKGSLSVIPGAFEKWNRQEDSNG